MQTEFTFALTGLSCGHCVKRLRTLLENQPALRILSLDIRQMQLVADCSAEEIKQLVAQAGYHAELLTPPATGLQQALPKPTRSSSMPKLPKQNMLHLAIEGMTCTQCVATVTRALSSVTGVDSVQVNLAENHAYIDGTPVLADLLTASQNAGYPAKVLTDANRQQQRSIEKKKLRFLFWQAVLALIAAFTIMAWGMTTTATQANFSTHVWYAIALITALLILTTGGHFYLKALRSLKNKTATMDTLVTLSTSIAWIYSTLRLLQPAWFPANTQHYYFEASLMIIGLVNLGQVLEHRARAQASDSLNKLLALTPNEVMVVTAEGDKQLPLQQVTTGMQLRVRAGESVPVDGRLLTGSATLDESMLTGESWPQHKGSTARVFAGTLVRTGGFTMQAEATGENTLLAKIVDNVRRAQSSKPPIAKLVDQITRYFVPTIIVIALLSAAIWWFIGPSPRTAYSLIIFTTVLIIACPCALGLATPMAVIAGISRAAQAGVLVRAADALQAANQIDTIIFDKIGTLTEGRPSVVSLALLPQWQQQSETWLTLVAALERNSTHPLANAITTYIPHHPLPNVVSWQEHLGKGLSGQIAGHDVHVGNLRLMKELDISLPPLLDLQQQTDTRSAIHVFIAIDKQPVGMFAIQDSLRPEAISVVAKLQQAGLKTLILTGDDSRIARDIAASVGIDSFIAEVLPQDKAQHIQVLQKQGRRVAMVGDGINDAPALACADLSIAMGSGSDIALSCADLILLTADLNSLPASLTIVKATLGNIKQNLYGAFFYNGLSIPIAAGILYPFTGLLLNPMLASAAMALSSLTVVLNANRLLRLKVK